MDIPNLLDLMEKLDNDEKLPDGWSAENIHNSLRSNIDSLADEKARLDANLIITSERAKEFAATKKVSGNEIARFKKYMVHIFNSQEGKKFPGTNFIANIVKKTTLRTTREPTFTDYTDKDRMKFVRAEFEMTREPNAEVYACLKANGLGDFCGYKFRWDADLIKTINKADIEKKKKDPKNKDVSELSSFTEKVDSSYLQFKPRKN